MAKSNEDESVQSPNQHDGEERVQVDGDDSRSRSSVKDDNLVMELLSQMDQYADQLKKSIVESKKKKNSSKKNKQIKEQAESESMHHLAQLVRLVSKPERREKAVRDSEDIFSKDFSAISYIFDTFRTLIYTLRKCVKLEEPVWPKVCSATDLLIMLDQAAQQVLDSNGKIHQQGGNQQGGNQKLVGNPLHICIDSLKQFRDDMEFMIREGMDHPFLQFLVEHRKNTVLYRYKKMDVEDQREIAREIMITIKGLQQSFNKEAIPYGDAFRREFLRRFHNGVSSIMQLAMRDI